MNHAVASKKMVKRSKLTKHHTSNLLLHKNYTEECIEQVAFSSQPYIAVKTVKGLVQIRDLVRDRIIAEGHGASAFSADRIITCFI